MGLREDSKQYHPPPLAYYKMKIYLNGKYKLDFFHCTTIIDMSSTSSSPSPQSHEGAMTALAKFSMTIVKQQEAAIKNKKKRQKTD